MLSFGRGKLDSISLVNKKDSDSNFIISRATLQSRSEALCLPKNLKDVSRSQHRNVPKTLPVDNASQDEVRYYLYSILTCKDNVSAKAYPQWVLETCMSWEGPGERLRSMTDEELQILRPLRTGYAEIKPSRKHKLEDLPVPAARQTIGAAIARAVGAARLADLRRVSMHDSASPRQTRHYEPVDGVWGQMNSLRSSKPSQGRLQSSSSHMQRRESIDNTRGSNIGTRMFSPTLSKVHESHNEPAYLQRESLALTPRFNALPRHLNEARYAGTTDSSSIGSPVDTSIRSQDSNSTSQTSLGGLETAQNACSSPLPDRASSCTSSIASMEQKIPLYEHKETLAELEARSLEVPPNQGSPRIRTRPRRYRTTSGLSSSSRLRNDPSLTNDSKQYNVIRRPSRLRAAIQTDEFDQCQTALQLQHPYRDISPVENSYNPPGVHVGSSSYNYQRTSLSDSFHNQVNQQIPSSTQIPPDNLSFGSTGYSPHPLRSMQSQSPFANNDWSAPLRYEQDFFGEATRFQQQKQLNPNSSGAHIPKIPQVEGFYQENGSPEIHRSYTLSPRLSHSNLTNFPPAQEYSSAGLPVISSMSFDSVPSTGLPRSSHMDPVGPAQNYIRPVSVLPRAPNHRNTNSLAFDQADFHLWKGNFSPQPSTMAGHEHLRLAKSQSDNLLRRSRERQLRAAWNIDLHDRKDSAGPSLGYLNRATGQVRKTFYEAIEEREIMDGKPQRGVDSGLGQEWRRYH
jgi:hypothetical protein